MGLTVEQGKNGVWVMRAGGDERLLSAASHAIT
jgi:hypothetical protein